MVSRINNSKIRTMKTLKRKFKKTSKKGGVIRIENENDENPFKCPISLELMVDPVVASDGHTYERRSIQGVLHTTKKSPFTREILTMNLHPNMALKSIMTMIADHNEDFRNQFEEAAREARNSVQNVQNIAFTTETLRDAVRMYITDSVSAVQQYGEIGTWDVSTVTNMNSMFSRALSFNQPLNDWNVSNVTDMENMFTDARSFNQPTIR